MLSDDDIARMDAEDDQRHAKLRRPEALANAARWYGRQGIAIFPLRPGGKAPLFKKVHPTVAEQKACGGACGNDGHGLYDATTDPDTIHRWWTATPQANIGLRTGLKVDVIDVDGPVGMLTYSRHIVHGACPPGCCDTSHCPGDGGITMQQLGGPVLAVAQTRGENGGLHLYIRPTGDTIGSNILPGIDYRGDGGYVVAPPSRGHLGLYLWQQPLTAAALEQTAPSA